MTAQVKGPSGDVVSRSAVVAIVLPVLLRLAAIILPGWRLWGVDVLQYFTPLLVMVFAVLPLILLFKAFPDWIARSLSHTGEKFHTAVFLLLSIIALISMLRFSMETFFYGDGSILVPEVYKLVNTPGYKSDILLNVKSSPLAGVLLEACTLWTPSVLKFLGLKLPVDAMYAFQVFGILCFLALVALLFFYRRGLDRILFLLLLMGTGGAVLFFSYAEFYAAVCVAVLWYVLATERYLAGAGRRSIVILAFMVAVACHYYAVVLLPSMLWVFAEKECRHPNVFASTRRMGMIIGAGFTAGLVLYVLAGFADSTSRIVMPVFSQRSGAGTQAYTLLSSSHVIDLVNVPLVLAPVPAIFLLIYLFTSGGRAYLRSPAFRFFALTIGSFTLFFWFANTSLGLARDWDMTTPAGTLISLAALHAILSTSTKRKEKAAIVLALGAFVTAAPWIIVHIDQQRSTQRFEKIVALDAKNMYGDYALSGYEALRKHYLHTGDVDNEIRTTKTMIDILHYAQHYILLHEASQTYLPEDPARCTALQQWMLGRLERKAADLRSRGLESDYGTNLKTMDSLTTMIAFSALNTRRYDTLSALIARICAQTGRSTPILLVDGVRVLVDDRFAVAAEKLSAVLGNGYHSNRLTGLCGAAFLHTQRRDEGRRLIDTSLANDANDPVVRFYAGYSLLLLNIDLPVAIQYLRDVVRLNPSSALGARAKLMLQRVSPE